MEELAARNLSRAVDTKDVPETAFGIQATTELLVAPWKRGGPGTSEHALSLQLPELVGAVAEKIAVDRFVVRAEERRGRRRMR
jgi:hypothetical protein